MAANTQALCTSFKVEILQGFHCLGGVGAVRSGGFDTFKAALYLQGTGLGAATTAYSPTGEASGAGYTAGGTGLVGQPAPLSSGTTAYWTPGNIQWTGLTINPTPVDCLLLYNTAQSNRAMAVLTFAPQTFSAGTFTYTMPANTATSALIQLN